MHKEIRAFDAERLKTLEDTVENCRIEDRSEDYPVLVRDDGFEPVRLNGCDLYTIKWCDESEFWDFFDSSSGEPICSIPAGYRGGCPTALWRILLQTQGEPAEGRDEDGFPV